MSTPTTTIATLCYESAPGFAFETLVREFEQALREAGLPVVARQKDYDDVAVYDIAGVRIGMGFADSTRESAVPRSPQVCLSISVGPGATTGRPACKGSALVAALVQRIAAVAAPDEVMWAARSEDFGPDLFDAVLAQIWPEAGANGLDFVLPPAPPPQEEAVVVSLGERLSDAARVFARKPKGAARPVRDVAAEAAARGAHPANDTPQVPHPMVEEARRIREALYAEDPEAPAREPVQRRLAIAALNCTLVLVSAPVGAAMLTHQVLGRQGFAAAARTLAITATAVGLGDLFLPGGLPLI